MAEIGGELRVIPSMSLYAQVSMSQATPAIRPVNYQAFSTDPHLQASRFRQTNKTGTATPHYGLAF